MILAIAIYCTPVTVAPRIPFKQRTATGLQEFLTQIRMLEEFGHTDIVHLLQLDFLPVLPELQMSAKPFGISRMLKVLDCEFLPLIGIACLLGLKCGFVVCIALAHIGNGSIVKIT